MTRSFNTVFSGSKWSIKTLQKMYVIQFRNGKTMTIDKRTFTPSEEIEQKTLIKILEDIEKSRQKRRGVR